MGWRSAAISAPPTRSRTRTTSNYRNATPIGGCANRTSTRAPAPSSLTSPTARMSYGVGSGPCTRIVRWSPSQCPMKRLWSAPARWGGRVRPVATRAARRRSPRRRALESNSSGGRRFTVGQVWRVSTPDTSKRPNAPSRWLKRLPTTRERVFGRAARISRNETTRSTR